MAAVTLWREVGKKTAAISSPRPTKDLKQRRGMDIMLPSPHHRIRAGLLGYKIFKVNLDRDRRVLFRFGHRRQIEQVTFGDLQNGKGV